MEIEKQYLVKYKKSKEKNGRAILMKTPKGYYLSYLETDGMGWSNRIKKIADDLAESLII